MPTTLGEAIDQIVTIPMRHATASVGRERISHLYAEARARQDGGALTMQAARRLHACVRPGDTVLLLTGIGDAPWYPAGETDGPPGLVSIARAVAYGLGATPVYLAEPGTLPACTAPSRAVGLPVRDPEAIQRFEIKKSAAAMPVPLGEAGARETARALLDRFRPTACLACEKASPNMRGEFPAGEGQKPSAVCDWVAPHLFDEARARGILTIGVGDVGNELGLAVVADVSDVYGGPNPPHRYGGQGSGVWADVSVLATCSNWGAYGITACLAYLTRQLDVLQTEEMEGAVLAACAAAGAVDFTTGTPVDHVDGRRRAVSQAVVTLLRAAVEGRLTDRPPSFLPNEYWTRMEGWPRSGMPEEPA
jgi:hypothetical protein